MEAGRPQGIANAGYRAIESLRLEKGYRAWGADIGPDHSPLMAGLGWAVKLQERIPFLGREALEEQKKRRLPRLLAGFTVDDPPSCCSAARRSFANGRRAGWLTSAGFGHTRAETHRLRLCARPGRRRRRHGDVRRLRARSRHRTGAGLRFADAPYDPGMSRIKA